MWKFKNKYEYMGKGGRCDKWKNIWRLNVGWRDEVGRGSESGLNRVCWIITDE
jgi:hypothetical protein